MKQLVSQMAEFSGQYQFILVSSGAVGSGKTAIKDFQGTTSHRKAAAAIGNPLLIQAYAQFFVHHGITVAQALCERHHFSERTAFLQLRETLETLWTNQIIPIANENDVVAHTELNFSDNDELAMMLAVSLKAKTLILGTDVEGLLDKEKKLVPVIHKFDKSIYSLANTESSAGGLGGMISKLNSADMATRFGVDVHICDITKSQFLKQSLDKTAGTFCPKKSHSGSAQQKWLASSSLALGKIYVDIGAYKAVKNRKSLLSVGVQKIIGDFPAKAIIEFWHGKDKKPFAVAQSTHGADMLQKALVDKTSYEIAHTDKIVLL
jgi:glutamate 5-kinase